MTRRELCRPLSRGSAHFGLGDLQLALWANDMGVGCADWWKPAQRVAIFVAHSASCGKRET